MSKINDEKSNPRKTKHKDLPLRRIIKCGHCKKSISPQKKKGKVYYYCYNSKCQSQKTHLQNQKLSAKEGITGEELFNNIAEILQKEFKLGMRQYTAYLLYLEKRNQMKHKLKGQEIKGLTARITYLKKELNTLSDDLKKKLVEAKNPMVIDQLVSAHSEEEKRLKMGLKKAEEDKTKLESSDMNWVGDFEKFLEQTKNLYSKWKNASLSEKSKIAQNVFLELVIKDGKVASYRYKDLYSDMKKVNSSSFGGLVAVKLEHLIESIIRNPSIYQRVQKMPSIIRTYDYDTSIHFSPSVRY